MDKTLKLANKEAVYNNTIQSLTAANKLFTIRPAYMLGTALKRFVQQITNHIKKLLVKRTKLNYQKTI